MDNNTKSEAPSVDDARLPDHVEALRLISDRFGHTFSDEGVAALRAAINALTAAGAGGEAELADWRALFNTYMTGGSIWPNKWCQDVAAFAFLIRGLSPATMPAPDMAALVNDAMVERAMRATGAGWHQNDTAQMRAALTAALHAPRSESENS